MTQPNLADPHPLIDEEVVTNAAWRLPELKPWEPKPRKRYDFWLCVSFAAYVGVIAFWATYIVWKFT